MAMHMGMKTLSIWLGVFVSLGMIVACSDDTTPDNDDDNSTSTTSSSSGASTSSSGSSSSGGGGAGGSGSSSSSSGSSSSGMMGSAYGSICNQALPCPMGQQCLTTGPMAVSGICSIECQGQMDQTTCSVFMGPGKGICNISVKDPNGGADKFYCNIACGAQYALPEDCPVGMTCKDQVGPNGMPDGKNDSCTPP